MLKRTSVTILWFVSVWMTYGLVAYFLGMPDYPGGVLGALVAAFVFMDPAGVMWGSAARSPRRGIVAPGTLQGSQPAR